MTEGPEAGLKGKKNAAELFISVAYYAFRLAMVMAFFLTGPDR